MPLLSRLPILGTVPERLGRKELKRERPVGNDTSVVRQKRPTIKAKETYYQGKRDLLSLIMEAKETY